MMSEIAQNMLIAIASAVMGIVGLHLLNVLLGGKNKEPEKDGNIYILNFLYHPQKSALNYTYYLLKAILIIVIINIISSLLISIIIFFINPTSLNSAFLNFNYFLALDSFGRALAGFIIWGLIGFFIFTIGRKEREINFYIFINCGFICGAFIFPLSSYSYIFERCFELYTPNDLYNLEFGALVRLLGPVPIYTFGYGFLLGMISGFAKSESLIRLLYTNKYKIFFILLFTVLSLIVVLEAHHQLHFALVSLYYKNVAIIWGGYFALFLFFLLLGSSLFEFMKKHRLCIIKLSGSIDSFKSPRILSSLNSSALITGIKNGGLSKFGNKKKNNTSNGA